MTYIWTVTNLKPGTGKTTSAVWLAYALHELGKKVALADADPGGTRLKIGGKKVEELGRAGIWNDLAPFPFPYLSLPSSSLHQVLPAVGADFDVVVVDSPPLEDAQGIATSAIRAATTVILSVAPTAGEISGMAPVLEVIEDINPLRAESVRTAVLLNRCVAGAASTGVFSQQLTDKGHNVLGARIPRQEVYAQSHGAKVKAAGTPFQGAALEILEMESKTS
ncbi:AAA family ATPase [Streptomyces virginiae]|uniref:AAA family ATPase n=1 Tax=Streptomyces virginiae TaxID=1961 RepID=UPI00364BA9B1